MKADDVTFTLKGKKITIILEFIVQTMQYIFCEELLRTAVNNSIKKMTYLMKFYYYTSADMIKYCVVEVHFAAEAARRYPNP